MAAAIADRFKVIDVDTHLIEPPDLWTSRMARKWGDEIPHVECDPQTGEDIWVVGGRRLARLGTFAHAGWHEYPPLHPPTWADIDPATWDAKLRLQRMDEFGVHAQVLYPNINLFHPSVVVDDGADIAVTFEYVRAYNDYQTEWCSAAPDRLIPVASVPFWDRSEAVAEMERCASMGHRGVVFSQEPGNFGLPMLTDPHWNPFWAAAEEMSLPVNFHIGSAEKSGVDDIVLASAGHEACGKHANTVLVQPTIWMGNASTLAKLICGGICHRFPRLEFVLVESGVSWIPFALDGLDWGWGNSGVAEEHPEYDLLPSEYFRRQIYGCFWFESAGARYAIERLGDDRILYETDFPHPTSQVPGLGTGRAARDFLEHEFAQLPDETLQRILHDNAARAYHL
jgi:uncharacterized protein